MQIAPKVVKNAVCLTKSRFVCVCLLCSIFNKTNAARIEYLRANGRLVAKMVDFYVKFYAENFTCVGVEGGFVSQCSTGRNK